MSETIGYRNLPLRLLKAREAILSHFRPILAHFGLTEQQWRILRVLGDVGSAEPRQLADLCQILSPSLTGILARMEEIDLVERARMAGDHRRVTVRLSRRAGELVAAIRPLIAEQYRLVEAAYGAPLIADLYAVTDRLIEAGDIAVPVVALPEVDRSGLARPAALVGG